MSRCVKRCLMLVCFFAWGCEAKSPCPRAELAPLQTTPAYAVVTSDYASTAIALLDSSAALITEAWIDSGTTGAVLSTTLSGDVVLPTSFVTRDVLTLIDRFGVDVLTRIGLPNGNVLAQIPTTPVMRTGDAAFRANPQDVVALDDGTALVSRHEPNLDPDAEALDRGNDLIRVDLTSGALLERIPFDALNVRDGSNTRFARPARMARIGDSHLVVGLARLSADFMAVAPGAVALVELSTREVREIPLEGLVNCGRAVPRTRDTVLVLCAGPPFGDETMRRKGAGLALLHMDDDGRLETRIVWSAAERTDLPPPLNGLVVLDETAVTVIAPGDTDTGAHDRIVTFDTETGQGAVQVEADADFVLGEGAYDPTSHMFLVPDAHTGMRRFRWSESLLTPLATVNVSPCRQLPARAIHAIER